MFFTRKGQKCQFLNRHLLMLGYIFLFLLIHLPSSAQEASYADLSSSSPVVYEEVRQKYENRVASSVQALLEKVVGTGKVSVSVRADLDFNQNIINNEIIDSNTPVIASSKINESQEERIYAFSKKNIQQIQKGGLIKKISVAVLVDSSVPQTLYPRMQTLVETTVGYDAARGDQVEFVSAAFKEAGWKEMLEDPLLEVLELVFLIGVLLLAIIFILSKSFHRRQVVPVSLPDFAKPEKVAEVLTSSSQEKVKTSDPLLKRVREQISSDPQEAIKVIRSWLYQGKEELSDD